MKTEIHTCDCGCGKQEKSGELTGWLFLKQSPDSANVIGEAQIPEMSFASFRCLEHWLMRALDTIPVLEKRAAVRRQQGYTTDNENGTQIFVQT